MDRLDAAVQPYPWGSHTAIAQLQGRPAPSERPEAELWMGAHPAAASGLVRDGESTTLDRVVEADPDGELGADVAQRFGGRLPFLLKVLAAERALSIQVHPDRATAEAGFRAENEAGLPEGDPGRNYRDDWPKPEVLCALTDFEALAGLREPGEAAALVAALEVPDLAPIVERLSRGDDDGLVEALRTFLAWPESERGDLLSRVVEAADARSDDDGHGEAFAALVRISQDHPGDLGALASLLLNHVVLRPGEALFMAAGGLHAYLRGTGIEILANSDNVLRAGLTGKHIDVDELCRIVEPAVDVPVLRPGPDDGGVTGYRVAVPEFRLDRLDVDAGSAAAVGLPGEGPRIVLVVEGDVTLGRGAEELTLRRGESAFVPASDGRIVCSGTGTAFVAGVGAPGGAGDADDAGDAGDAAA